MPLGQRLQPGHTLAAVAIQGGDRSPRLQAPDVYQAALRPVSDKPSRVSGGRQKGVLNALGPAWRPHCGMRASRLVELKSQQL